MHLYYVSVYFFLTLVFEFAVYSIQQTHLIVSVYALFPTLMLSTEYNLYTYAHATSPFPSCHFGLRGPTAPREQQQASPLQLLHLCGMVAAEGFTNQPPTHPQVCSMTNSDPPSLVVTSLITP